MDEMKSGYNTDKPPEDDCCPICFGEFKVPCKTNCGHWFCGSCIIRYWEHRSRRRQCRCPFCSSGISTLAAELSSVNKTEDGVVEVLQNIEQYNHFYVKGLKGYLLIFKFYLWNLGLFLMRSLKSPVTIDWRVLVDPMRHHMRLGQNSWIPRIMIYFLTVLVLIYFGVYKPGGPRGIGKPLPAFDFSCKNFEKSPF